MRRILLAPLLIFVFVLASCTGPQTKGDGGSVPGAGGNATSTASGAPGVGALSGAKVGEYMDRQEKDLRERLAQTEGVFVRRDQDTLQVTFKSDLLFDIDSTYLKPIGHALVVQVAGLLRDYPQTRLTVEGHTDSIGSERRNQERSERRAQAVKAALSEAGVDPTRISAKGLGELKPLTSNATERGRQLNRRVVLTIVPERQ
jgi:outer membrane protein OmpA-like peptidoglycan-associated protein